LEAGELDMKAILLGTYTPNALKGLMQGSDRKSAVEALFNQVGATLDSITFTRGRYDVVVTAEFPNSTSLMGATTALKASGAFAETEYLEAVDLPSIIESANKAANVYKPAG